jgi:hypothetical protein
MKISKVPLFFLISPFSIWPTSYLFLALWMLTYRVDIMKITKGPPFLFNFQILNLADKVVPFMFLAPWMLSYRVDIMKIAKGPMGHYEV